jgi:sulfofructose kinase
MNNKHVICVGAACWDTVFQVEQIPAAGVKALALHAVQRAAGMAVNAAVALSRLGMSVHMWTRIGDDETGRLFMQEMQRERINADGVRVLAGVQTSFSSILVDLQGERTLVPFFDAKIPPDASWLPLDKVAGAGAVLVDMRWLEGAVAALRHARQCGVPGILDADTAPAQDLNDMIPLASHVLFSASALNIVRPGMAPEAALRDVAGHNPADVVGVTLGPEGALLWTRESGCVLHEPAPRIQAVDTLGAGDVWHGAFAWGLVRGLPMPEIVQWANLAAAMKCEVFGGVTGTPTWAQLQARAARETETPRVSTDYLKTN